METSGVSFRSLTPGLTILTVSHQNSIKHWTQLLPEWRMGSIHSKHVSVLVCAALIMLAATSMSSNVATNTWMTSSLLMKLSPVLCNVSLKTGFFVLCINKDHDLYCSWSINSQKNVQSICWKLQRCCCNYQHQREHIKKGLFTYTIKPYTCDIPVKNSHFLHSLVLNILVV